MTKKEAKALSELKKQATKDFQSAMQINFDKLHEQQELCSADTWFLMGKKYYEAIKGEGKVAEYNKEMTRRCFTLASVGGNKKYMKLLSDCYFSGLFGKSELCDQEGMHYLELAASEENPEWYTNMALRYLYGRGVKTNQRKAFTLFKVAADLGKDAMAARYVGEFYDGTIETDDVKESGKDALEYYKIAAEGGDSYGQCLYGKEFYSGKNTEQNYEKAFELFSKSAEQNDPNGIFMQAQCIWFGFGVEKDKEKAFELFKKAADLGSAQGALDAGKALYLGEGTKKNVKEALFYFEKSAEKGVDEAKNALEVCKMEIGE